MADWKEQSLRLWQNIGKKQRYAIIGSAVLIFILILSWSYWWGSKPDMVPLFTNMEAKDAGEVAAKLKEMKVSFEPQENANGTAILVSAKDVHRVRLELASLGLPRGNKGFEIFDQNKFGVTEFQNKVYLLQALQGELTRTIEQMDEVEKARVHIVLPEDSLYKKNEKPATASIMVKLRPSAQLTKEQVKGIVNLAAHSIQGLKPENITVVDNYAHVLNDQQDESNMPGSGSMTQLEMTRKMQDDLQKNLDSLLDQVLGPGKAAARVNVELTFDQHTVDKQVYEPVVDDKGIIRSSQDTNERYQGTASTPGGVPGTTTNIPGYVTGNNTQSNYEKKDSIKNYEINETKEKVVAAPGAIKRLTVAVLVDASLNKAQQDSIAKTVSSAIGINPARGDMVSVESIAFNTDMADRERLAEEAAQRQNLWIKIGLAVIALIIILLGVRAYFARKKQQRQEAEMLEALQESQLATLEQAEMAEPELTPQEKEKLERQELIAKMAKTNPDDVAQLIKAWLSEE